MDPGQHPTGENPHVASGQATWITGGVDAPLGIHAAGVASGIRKDASRKDLALICADEPVVAAGVFTQSAFCAPPVTVSKEQLEAGRLRAILINSGCANAATGARGLAAAHTSVDLVAKHLGCDPGEVAVASTGVIGTHLPTEKIATALPGLVEAAAATGEDGGLDAAEAIMTTDTHPKEAAIRFMVENACITCGGMAKGSGMIAPDMATMIAVLTTDAPLTQRACTSILSSVVNATFNRVTIDTDTSTNDCCFLLATGAADLDAIEADTPEAHLVEQAILSVAERLARDIARDGEGASKLITVNVSGAETEEDAIACARAIANSPLVKTAVFGHDANWGRIAMAAGKSGARFSQDEVSIHLMGILVCEGGLAVDFDEAEALRRFEEDEIIIEVSLGEGPGASTFWTCDLTYDYVRINGEYRT